MEEWLNGATVEKWLAAAEAWLRAEVFVPANPIELAGVVVALGFAWLVAPVLRRGCNALIARIGAEGWIAGAIREFEENALAVVWLFIQWLMHAGASGAALGGRLIGITVSLLAAWVVIQFTSILIRDRALRRTAASRRRLRPFGP